MRALIQLIALMVYSVGIFIIGIAAIPLVISFIMAALINHAGREFEAFSVKDGFSLIGIGATIAYAGYLIERFNAKVLKYRPKEKSPESKDVP